MITQKIINDLSYSIIGSAIEINREIGPGLMESVYEKCLLALLKEKGLKVGSQEKVKFVYKNINIDCELRLDILVEDLIIVELKAVSALLPIHEAQLLTYLTICHKPKGILLNFNCKNIASEGKITLVTELYSRLPKGY